MILVNPTLERLKSKAERAGFAGDKRIAACLDALTYPLTAGERATVERSFDARFRALTERREREAAEAEGPRAFFPPRAPRKVTPDLEAGIASYVAQVDAAAASVGMGMRREG